MHRILWLMHYILIRLNFHHFCQVNIQTTILLMTTLSFRELKCHVQVYTTESGIHVHPGLSNDQQCPSSRSRCLDVGITFMANIGYPACAQSLEVSKIEKEKYIIQCVCVRVCMHMRVYFPSRNQNRQPRASTSTTHFGLLTNILANALSSTQCQDSYQFGRAILNSILTFSQVLTSKSPIKHNC